MEDGRVKVRINAEGRVLRWNPRTEQYDIDPMGWVCRSDKVFGVSAYNTNQLQLSELAGSEGGGTSGLKRMMVVMRRIDLNPAPATTGNDSMDVTAVVRCDLVSTNQYDGDQRLILQSVKVPLSWHVAVRSDTPAGIAIEFRPREKSERAGSSPMAKPQR